MRERKTDIRLKAKYATTSISVRGPGCMHAVHKFNSTGILSKINNKIYDRPEKRITANE